MNHRDTQHNVLDLLKRLRGLDPLKELFWRELNYERVNQPLSRRGWTETASEALADDPVLFAGGGENNEFHVIYARLASARLLIGNERPAITRLLNDHPYALFVVSNKAQDRWHFLNVKYDEHREKRRLFRRITVQPGGDGLRTATERLQMLDVASIDRGLFGISALQIQNRHDEAFDVEKVTKAFYNEIANWYFWAREHAIFPKDAPLDSDGKPSLPIIQLLTRLIFCWFLREKRNPQTDTGLIPDDLFDPRRIKDLIKDSSPEACSYYTAILQNLFFATLNTEMDKPGEPANRRFLNEGDGQRSDEHMVHQLWRHASQLRDPAVLAQLLRDIPFLNGGLFECLDDRVQRGNSPYTVEVRIDGFSTDPKKQPKVPNFLFYGAPQVADLSVAYGDSSRRRETVSPVLNILRRYHFTLTENTPLDQEVALDPELLGHVFENLLAAYNPETGMVARKSTGSFYTPRVVVDWMGDQALLVYFNGALGESALPGTNARIQKLLAWEDDGHDFSPAETNTLIDAIDHLKVIDPACGSGAFPMGTLQKLVHVLRKLDPKNKGWRARQLNSAQGIESSPAREEALKAIDRAFARDNDDYGRKLYLIENCLYGVDIQPIAAQIAKLRFFISLVVDQTIEPIEENYGILPLPNLETKIVVANTLLGLHRGQLLLGSVEVNRLEDELKKVRHDYFTARSYKRKKELRARDKELCVELSRALSDSGERTPLDSKRLAEWNPYDTNTSAPFFDPGWMFGLPSKNNDGAFDVVIGNPPYVRQEELKNRMVIGSDGNPQSLKAALKGQYECYTGTADLYVYFFERSLQLLRTGGVLSFITSNKYFRAAYGERLRTYLAFATRPSVVLDFGDAPVFTSIAYPAILVTQKTRSVALGQLPKKVDAENWESRVMRWSPGPDIREFPEIFDREAFALSQRNLKPDGWRLEGRTGLEFLDILRAAGTPLHEYVGARVYRGITTGFNKAFEVDRTTRDLLIEEHPSSENILKPFLRGRDVERWALEPGASWLIFTRRGIDIKKYPAILKHLKKFKKHLMPGVPGGRKPGSYEWFEIQDNIAYWKEFERVKLISTKVSIRPTFALDTAGYYLGNTAYFIPTKSDARYLLALLNSSLFYAYAKRIFVEKQGGWYEVQPHGLELFPVPTATPDQKSLCEQLAEAIIWLHGPHATKKTNDASASTKAEYFERWLNGLVYELFFPGDLHSRSLWLFDESAKLAPPDLARLSESEKVLRLDELFEKAHDSKATLRAQLFDLSSLEVVRLIEEGLIKECDQG